MDRRGPVTADTHRSGERTQLVEPVVPGPEHRNRPRGSRMPWPQAPGAQSPQSAKERRTAVHRQTGWATRARARSPGSAANRSTSPRSSAHASANSPTHVHRQPPAASARAVLAAAPRKHQSVSPDFCVAQPCRQTGCTRRGSVGSHRARAAVRPRYAGGKRQCARGGTTHTADAGQPK
jgi:hypothetical protein